MSDDPGNDGGLFELLGKIHITLDGINSRAAAQQARWLQGATDIDKNYPVTASGICPAGGANFSFSVGEPNMGRVRTLHRLIVGGTLATTTAMGSAYIFVSPADPLLTALSLTTMVDFSTTLPFVHYNGRDEILVRHPDQVWVVIVGGTAGQQYSASAFWESYQDGGYQATVEL